MNKYFFLILVAAITLVSCNNRESKVAEPQNAVIEGKITGFNQPLVFYGDNGSAEIQPDPEGNFIYETSIARGTSYTLAIGIEKRQVLYLEPGANIFLEIDYNKLIEKDRSAIRISGLHSEESELLYRLAINNDRFKYTKEEYRNIGIPKVYDRDPEDFISYQEEQLKTDYTFIDEFVKLHKETDKDFISSLKLNLMIDYNRNFQLYNNYQQLLNTDRSVIPDSFDDYFAGRIPQDDWDLYKENSVYANYIRGKYYEKAEKALADYPRESLEWYKARVSYLENCDFPDIITQSIWDGFTIGYMRTRDPEIREYITGIINEKVSDKNALKGWEDYKARDEGYADGDPAPDFTYKDINGTPLSLSDFRGKLVYIDLWASWCLPCMEGVPYFSKMRKEYADKKIVFLAVSLDENIDAWKEKITENKDGNFDGIQLNTGSYQCDISDNFVLDGIPQYILIGADGRIIKKNAPRPHGSEIKKLIDRELKKLN